MCVFEKNNKPFLDEKFKVDPERYEETHKSFFKFQSTFYLRLLGDDILINGLSKENGSKFITFVEDYERNMDAFLRDGNDKSVLLYLKSWLKRAKGVDSEFINRVYSIERKIKNKELDLLDNSYQKEVFYRKSSLNFIRELYQHYEKASSDKARFEWGVFFAEYAFMYYLLTRIEIIPEDAIYTDEIRKITRHFISSKNEPMYSTLSDPMQTKLLPEGHKVAFPVGYEGINQKKYERLVKDFKNWLNE